MCYNDVSEVVPQLCLQTTHTECTELKLCFTLPGKFKVESCLWYFELIVYFVENGNTRSFL